MNVQDAEVTLFYEPSQYRDFAGTNRTRYRFSRIARIHYKDDDGKDLFCPVEIVVSDSPHSDTEDVGVVSFFLEATGVRDNGGGEVVHEVLAEMDV